MTLKDFIKEKYPICDKVRALNSDPVKQILEQDDLPCDGIMMVDGILQKVVYVSDENYVPVVEILSYYAEEVKEMQDEEFKTAYFAYMDNVDITDVTIEVIMSASRECKEKREERNGLMSRCIQ